LVGGGFNAASSASNSFIRSRSAWSVGSAKGAKLVPLAVAEVVCTEFASLVGAGVRTSEEGISLGVLKVVVVSDEGLL